MKTINDYKKQLIYLIQEMEKEHGACVKGVSVSVSEENYTEPMTGEKLNQREYDIEIIF